jgi:hypothetical protein
MVEGDPGPGLAALASSLVTGSPEEVDLTDPDQEAWVRGGAERIEAVAPSPGELRALERRLRDDGAPVGPCTRSTSESSPVQTIPTGRTSSGASSGN